MVAIDGHPHLGLYRSHNANSILKSVLVNAVGNLVVNGGY